MAGDLPLVDQVVKAVRSKSAKASQLALRYFHETWDAEGNFLQDNEIDSGGFVPWDRMDFWRDRAETDEPYLNREKGGLNAVVTPERYDAICEGARVTAKEKRKALLFLLTAFFAEPVEGPMYQLLAVDDSAGRRVVATVIATDGGRTFVGMYRSKAAALRALKPYGIISPKGIDEWRRKKRSSIAPLGYREY